MKHAKVDDSAATCRPRIRLLNDSGYVRDSLLVLGGKITEPRTDPNNLKFKGGEAVEESNDFNCFDRDVYTKGNVAVC